MNEQRWGEQWKPGDRVRYGHPDPNRRDIVEGRIKERTWGRQEGKPIYNFTVIADGETETWVIGPRQVQAPTGQLPGEEKAHQSNTTLALPMPPLGDDNASLAESATSSAPTSSDVSEYPVPYPESTGFGPLDSDNKKEWRKDKARWEKGQRRPGSSEGS